MARYRLADVPAPSRVRNGRMIEDTETGDLLLSSIIPNGGNVAYPMRELVVFTLRPTGRLDRTVLELYGDEASHAEAVAELNRRDGGS